MIWTCTAQRTCPKPDPGTTHTPVALSISMAYTESGANLPAPTRMHAVVSRKQHKEHAKHVNHTRMHGAVSQIKRKVCALCTPMHACVDQLNIQESVWVAQKPHTHTYSGGQFVSYSVPHINQAWIASIRMFGYDSTGTTPYSSQRLQYRIKGWYLPSRFSVRNGSRREGDPRECVQGPFHRIARHLDSTHETRCGFCVRGP